jgi:DNA-binding transcriptional ArsR family regulator
MKRSIASLGKIFTALSSQSRLGILLYIHDKHRRCKGRVIRCQNEACIKNLAKAMNITMPTASHHIRELVNAGLVTTEKNGKWVYCTINKKAFREAVCFLSRWSVNKTK